jgi:hypothetical protein
MEDLRYHHDDQPIGLVVSGESRAYVAWTAPTEDYKWYIYLAGWTGTAWERLGQPLAATEGRQPYTGLHLSLALDSTGHPVVAWSEGGEPSANIYVRRWSGTEWDAPWGADGLPGCTTAVGRQKPALRLTSEDRPIVAFLESGVCLVRWGGAGWDAPERVFTLTSYGLDAVALALDGQNQPVVMWEQLYELYSRQLRDGAWGESIQWTKRRFGDLELDGECTMPTLTVDSTGTPIAAWSTRDRVVLGVPAP